MHKVITSLGNFSNLDRFFFVITFMLVDDVISFIPNQALRIIQGKFYKFYRKWCITNKEIKLNGQIVDLD